MLHERLSPQAWHEKIAVLGIPDSPADMGFLASELAGASPHEAVAIREAMQGWEATSSTENMAFVILHPELYEADESDPGSYSLSSEIPLLSMCVISDDHKSAGILFGCGGRPYSEFEAEYERRISEGITGGMESQDQGFWHLVVHREQGGLDSSVMAQCLDHLIGWNRDVVSQNFQLSPDRVDSVCERLESTLQSALGPD